MIIIKRHRTYKYRIKSALGYVLSALALLIFSHCQQITNPRHIPKPTQVRLNQEETEQKNSRNQWLEDVHRHAWDVDWKSLETQNTLVDYQNKIQKYGTDYIKNKSSELVESFGNGTVEGIWKERGSPNQSGSVLEVAYIERTNQIIALSAGGSLFTSDLDGNSWQVMNDQLRFSDNYLYVTKGDLEHERILCAINAIPYYSDDDGLTWQKSVSYTVGEGSRIAKSILLKDQRNQQIFVLVRRRWFDNTELWTSTDMGQQFHRIHSFGTSDLRNVSMCNPHNSEEIYCIEQVAKRLSRIWKYNAKDDKLDLINSKSPHGFGEDGSANIEAFVLSDTTYFYSFNEESMLKLSTNKGNTWGDITKLPEQPWNDAALYILPSNPNIMFIGEVNAYRSADRGKNWTLVNEWYEYYDFPDYKLHADIMNYKEFVDKDDAFSFTTVANHGGLNISYDEGLNFPSISQSGLNISQYYDVTSSPKDPSLMIAGSQDQGLQRAFITDENTIPNFEQVISGDYGHTVFTGIEGEHMWTIYPGGWLTYYEKPMDEYLTYAMELKYNANSAWIPPLYHYNGGDDVIYLLGGSMNHVNESHLIRLDITDDIVYEENSFNFSKKSGEYLSAFAIAPTDTSFWYAATSTGTFYRSEDAGDSWAESSYNLPNSHYLYGSHILASLKQQGLIYIAGSGYSNPSVMKSEDHGLTFTDMSIGLPPTTVFNLVEHPTKNILFAATEAGPYVYNGADGIWYSLSGINTPAQTFWSVEYISKLNIARFATYGRGAWDFEIKSPTSTQFPENIVNARIYPNPSSDKLYLKMDGEIGDGAITLHIYDQAGKLFKTEYIPAINASSQITIDINNLPNNLYILKIFNKNKTKSIKFVKI